MKVPQGFAWSKGSQGSVSNKMFLAKKKAKENILGSHLSESKLTHIRIMCSPHMLLLLFFRFMHSCPSLPQQDNYNFFNNCYKSEKCFNFGKNGLLVS